MDVVTLWHLCSAGMGAGHLPDSGGASEQACWLLEAFALMSAMERELKKQTGV